MSSDLTDRDIIPMYINPQRIDISEKKIISSQQTKGGFMTQYWGEDLPRISVGGKTGSGGIDAVNILRDVYRHEQIFFRRELIERRKKLNSLAEQSLLKSDEINSFDEVVGAILSINPLDPTGIGRELFTGIETSIDVLKNGGFSNLFSTQTEDSNILTFSPTPAAFAMSIDMVFQGEKFRGYFTDFQVLENAESPGLFDYNFNFVVLRRSGKRTNFMPWHRNPTDANGIPVSASIPTEGPREDELTFSSTQTSIIGDRFSTSTFTTSQEAATEDINNVGVSRFDKIKR